MTSHTSDGAGQDESTDHGRPSVLIVDDDADLRLIIRLLLGRGGQLSLVGEAADGPKAIELAAAEHPDIILLDLRMPGMNGWEALPKLREVSPGSMVIIWSALEAAPEGQDLDTREAFAYLDKKAAVSCLNSELGRLYQRFSAETGAEPHRWDAPETDPADRNGNPRS